MSIIEIQIAEKYSTAICARAVDVAQCSQVNICEYHVFAQGGGCIGGGGC